MFSVGECLFSCFIPVKSSLYFKFELEVEN